MTMSAQAISSSDARIHGLLGRLEAVLDDENARIGKDSTLDLEQTNALKSRCLYDMAMLMRDIDERGVAERHGDQLAVVRDKLDINIRRIRAHVEAVREVTAIMKDVAAAAEADGTYSADQFKADAAK